MKLLILVLSLWDNDIYTDFYKAQKETWDSFNVDNVDVFYYFGENNEKNMIKDKIYTNTPEGINNCGIKTLSCFEKIKDFNFDYIFRTNSSSYIDKEMLKEYLNDKPRTNYYSGDGIGDFNGYKFASGCGYIISRDIFDLIIKEKNNWDHNFIDDVSLGILLNKHNILPTLSPRYDVVNDLIPNNYYHYRLKTNNRKYDIQNMYKIFKNKYKR